ncbi:MAG: HAMP domain-containing sensor histidine kinase [Pseudomonadota bacterium]
MKAVWRAWPVTLRVALATGVMMVLLGLIASQQVLSTLTTLQNDRLREVAQSHVDGLGVALSPFVLHRDVWEVYDALDRAQKANAGARILFTAVADDSGRVLASTDPSRAPIDMEIESLFDDAVPVQNVIAGDSGSIVRIREPLHVQGREVGAVLTELDVSDLVAQRRNTSLALLAANTLATLVLGLAGYWIVARLLKPVELLTSHMGALGGTPHPISDRDIPKSDSTLKQLLHKFNDMVGAIEARTEVDKRLAERERFVSLGRLSSSLAHEVNNPLGGLLNATDTLRTYPDRPEVVRDAADILDRGLNHLRDVAQAILDENRRDRSERPLEQADFDDLKLLFEPEIKRLSQSLDWHINGSDADFKAWPSAPIRQISLNLLLNASAAAGQGGNVALVVDIGSDTFSLIVTDDGPGLSRQAEDRLLSTTPLEPGGGVGLRLVRDLVAELGGEIAVSRANAQTSILVRCSAREADA